MADPSKAPFSPEDLLASWMKASSDFLGAMAKLWSVPPADKQPGPSSMGTDAFSRAWASGLKHWAMLSSSMGEPGAGESLTKAFEAVPAVSLRLVQTGMNGFALFQKRWSERLKKIGESAGAYDFTDLDKDFLNRWTEAYQQEFRQFLKVPQLGLTRVYQEKLNDTVDRYNLFQAALTEFVHLFFVPVEKSLHVLQAKISEMADQGKLPQDSKQVYGLWVKILEGHYMTLFQSPEYASAMNKTLQAMNDFLSSREEVLEGLLKMFSVPSQKEMDELYREIYRLKKRVKDLEKNERPAAGRRPKASG